MLKKQLKRLETRRRLRKLEDARVRASVQLWKLNWEIKDFERLAYATRTA